MAVYSLDPETLQVRKPAKKKYVLRSLRFSHQLKRRLVSSSILFTIIWTIIFLGLVFYIQFMSMDAFNDLSKTYTPLELDRKVSVVVPTYKENDNLKPLVKEFFKATRASNLEAELLIVDDNSDDGSVETIAALKKDYNVKILVRTEERGLASAVLHGFNAASYDILVVMDADLSHPPSACGGLIEPVINGKADFAVASRYIRGGGVKNWPLMRLIQSRVAGMLALPLADVHDPMSGFFALRKDLYKIGCGKNLTSGGFKIGLELLVKCHPEKVVEFPYIFQDRVRGQSKLKMKTQLQYLKQLYFLYFYKYPLVVLFFYLSVILFIINVFRT